MTFRVAGYYHREYTMIHNLTPASTRAQFIYSFIYRALPHTPIVSFSARKLARKTHVSDIKRELLFGNICESVAKQIVSVIALQWRLN